MALRFVITFHALRRFVERYAGIGLKVGQIRLVLRAELERGVPLGGQVGKSTLYLLPCGLVAAVAWNHGRGFVKTVLTREQTISSIESRGAFLRFGRAQPHQVREARRQEREAPHAATANPTAKQELELRALAERHLRVRADIKERNAALREQGYNPGSRAGEFYRAAYQAAVQAYLAWKPEAEWCRDPPLSKTG